MKKSPLLPIFLIVFIDLLGFGIVLPLVPIYAKQLGIDQNGRAFGQFESTAEAMDRWLTFSFLEAQGGGQARESYELALYFLARHTELDPVRKRGKKDCEVFSCRDGSGCSLLPPFVRLSIEGTAGNVGIGASELLVVAGSVLPSGAGLPACESKAHPPRKEKRLVIRIQTRKPSFNGFIMVSLGPLGAR